MPRSIPLLRRRADPPPLARPAVASPRPTLVGQILPNLRAVVGFGAPVMMLGRVATREAGEPSDALLGRADRALYEAKANGRNRVRLAA